MFLGICIKIIILWENFNMNSTLSDSHFGANNRQVWLLQSYSMVISKTVLLKYSAENLVSDNENAVIFVTLWHANNRIRSHPTRCPKEFILDYFA